MLVSVSGVFRVDNLASLDAQTDAVMDALLTAEAASGGVIRDPDVEAVLAEGLVRISVVVEAESIAAAQDIGIMTIETAIIEADGNVVSIAHPRSTVTGFVEESRQAELLPA
ncbi:MAG: hypothetical protein KF680_01025 [Cryobacterium sp.]|nr:hypothetical protein [Cryobacterium sp.]